MAFLPGFHTPFRIRHRILRGRRIRHILSSAVAPLLMACALTGGVLTYLTLASSPLILEASAGLAQTQVLTRLLTFEGVILFLLSAVIIRKIQVLWHRRQDHAGAASLQIRMAAMFAGMATVPAVLLALFSILFVQQGVSAWFSHQISTAVHEAQNVAEGYLSEHRNVIQSDLLAAAADIDRQSFLVFDSPRDVERFLGTQSFLRNFSELVLFTDDGRVLARGGVGLSFDPPDVPMNVMQSALSSGQPAVFTSSDDDEKIQAVVKLARINNLYLYGSRSVDPAVLSHVMETRTASARYQDLENRRDDIQFRFFMIYVAVTLLVMLASVWAGLAIAGRFLKPIDQLMSAAQQVRAGNLDTRVPGQKGVDEFNDLIRVFNMMTSELKLQRAELILANHRIDARRRFTETILAGITTGVMALDAHGVIRLINEPGARILSLPVDRIAGQSVRRILPHLYLADPATLNNMSDVQQSEIAYMRPDGQKRILLIRMAHHVSLLDQPDGSILTFDDITDLQAAQRQTAWADVARRVAHEIKNPLTPIQLSAERLRRRFLKDKVAGIAEQDMSIFHQCIDTILRHVGDIGRMAGDFSAFARMPEAVLKSEPLLPLLKEIIQSAKGHHPDIQFDLWMEPDMGSDTAIQMDAPLLRQALLNLILNAYDAVLNRVSSDPETPGKVVLYAGERDGRLILSVMDNGIGFPSHLPLERLFEPYVTFREKGTGLGLTIVKKIIEDHKGSMVLNAPQELRSHVGIGERGAMVSVLLPIPLDQKAEVMENGPHAA